MSCAYHLAERAPGSTLSRWWTPSTRPPAASGRATRPTPGPAPAADRAVRRFRPRDEAQDAPGQRAGGAGRPRYLCARLDVRAGCGPASSFAGGHAVVRGPGGTRPPVQRLPRTRVWTCPSYSAGIRRPGQGSTTGRHSCTAPAATLDPAALICALARACADKGVRFYGRSPLLALRPGDLVGPELVLPHWQALRRSGAVLAANSSAAQGTRPAGRHRPAARGCTPSPPNR
ncbi:hypothetical protein LV779_24525 [Streptomyces thinghirensis]|nr:hypothetical protein [Streptomyces thinghirensis]